MRKGLTWEATFRQQPQKAHQGFPILYFAGSDHLSKLGKAEQTGLDPLIPFGHGLAAPQIKRLEQV
ncbi:MAG: hypothetical protein ACRD3O_15735, partial [Terriglobia bacterium]